MPTLSAIIALIRPKHWIKNFLVFAPLVFSLRSEPDLIAKDILGFIAFCAAASFVYIFNDLIDAPADRLHPTKKQRPIASGNLHPGFAIFLAILLLAFCLNLAALLPPGFLSIVLGYILINLIYTLGAKKLLLIDVMIIALGFVLRVIAGGLTIDVPVSNWILLCTFSVSLFLGFSKRKHENGVLDAGSKKHRQVLEHYTPDFLNQLIGVTSGLAIISYSLFTIDNDTVQHFQTDKLIYTVPFVVYGIFRYYHLIYNRTGGGDPAQIILKDRPTWIVIILWLALFIYLARYAH